MAARCANYLCFCDGELFEHFQLSQQISPKVLKQQELFGKKCKHSCVLFETKSCYDTYIFTHVLSRIAEEVSRLTSCINLKLLEQMSELLPMFNRKEIRKFVHEIRQTVKKLCRLPGWLCSSACFTKDEAQILCYVLRASLQSDLYFYDHCGGCTGYKQHRGPGSYMYNIILHYGSP